MAADDSYVSSSWRTINAVTLAAPDLPASLAFYRALGLVQTFRGAGFATVSAPAAGALGGGEAADDSNRLHVNLFTPADGADLTCYSAAASGRTIVHVRSVDAIYATAVAAGLAPLMPPADASWGERYFHIDDPAGHQLAFAQPLPVQAAEATTRVAAAAVAAVVAGGGGGGEGLGWPAAAVCAAIACAVGCAVGWFVGRRSSREQGGGYARMAVEGARDDERAGLTTAE